MENYRKRREKKFCRAYLACTFVIGVPPLSREMHGFAGSKSEENARYPGNAGWVGAAVARQDTRGSSREKWIRRLVPRVARGSTILEAALNIRNGRPEDPKILHRPWNPRFLFEYASPSDFDFAEFSPFSSTAKSLHLSRRRDEVESASYLRECPSTFSTERNFWKLLLLLSSTCTNAAVYLAHRQRVFDLAW